MAWQVGVCELGARCGGGGGQLLHRPPGEGHFQGPHEDAGQPTQHHQRQGEGERRLFPILAARDRSPTLVCRHLIPTLQQSFFPFPFPIFHLVLFCRPTFLPSYFPLLFVVLSRGKVGGARGEDLDMTYLLSWKKYLYATCSLENAFRRYEILLNRSRCLPNLSDRKCTARKCISSLSVSACRPLGNGWLPVD